MKTQISRQSFAADKRYSGVYQQMGRMITDADWNEFNDLVKHQLADALDDIVGSGTPRVRGCVVQTAPGVFGLRWGHLYVDGIHAQLRPDSSAPNPFFQYQAQLDFPGAPALSEGQHRLYLDVWERTVTSLEDSRLLDPGLKGADTCSRTRSMAQVKAAPTGISLEQLEGGGPVNPSLGTIPLSLSVRQGQTLKDPCDPCADELALQEDLGNYLFRVEVHDAGWSAAAVPQLERLVLKWSRENGAEQYRVGRLPPGFKSSNWAYEFFSGPDANPDLHMATEQHLGHHLAPGFTPQRGELSDGYPAAEPGGLTLVRRWDGFIELEKRAGNWVVTGGADRGRELSARLGENVQGFVDLSGPVVINLDALVLSFDLAAGQALAGDFWLAEVRQAVHTAGDVLLDAAPPQGICHHYLVLGLVDVDADNQIISYTPERGELCKPFVFPPLTDLRAEDICYNNDACEMPDVGSVQQAIDYLCKARDLRWHHKHLHGSGVVCGLIVECGPDTFPDLEGVPVRRQISVTAGSALNGEGDILALEDTDLDLITRIQRLEQESDKPILENGKGTACVFIELDTQGQTSLRIEAYDEERHDAGNIFDGTIWMDFYDHCIKGLWETLEEELGELDEDAIERDEEASGRLVSTQRRKLVTLINLFSQLVYKPHGRYVFLSQPEHVILRNFYNKLRELLQSKTYCGMFRGQEFPEYPFPDAGMQTWFGKNSHQRVEVHPNGRFLVSYQGADPDLNIYSAEKGTLLSVVDVPSGQGGTITAVTFDPGGELIYVATDLNGADSILSRGRFDDGRLKWESSAVLCGVTASLMRVDPEVQQLLYLLGRYDPELDAPGGLYVLDLEQLLGEEKVVPAPAVEFRAVGHGDFDFKNGLLFATAVVEASSDPQSYDGFVVVDLAKARSVAASNSPPTGPDQSWQLRDQAGQPRLGEDGLILRKSSSQGEVVLHVVVNGNGGKEIWRYESPQLASPPTPTGIVGNLADTSIALAYHPQQDKLLVSLEDEFRCLAIASDKIVTERIPLQLMPLDLAVNPNDGTLYALNYMSNTITAVPAAELDVSAAFNESLAGYRLDVLKAFMALAGNVLQYLKDCFCHHLLTRCPDGADEERLYLARVDIEDNKVHHICNFGKRREVHSFPKMEYWLSIVPVIPLIKESVSRLCCLLLPNVFSKWTDKHLEVREEPAAAVKGKQYRKGLDTYKRFDGKALVRGQRDNLAISGQLVSDTLVINARDKNLAGKQTLRNMQVEEAVARLEQQQARVEVVEYNPKYADRYIKDYRGTPARIPPDSDIQVIKQGERVMFYTLQKRTQAPLLDSAEIEGQLDEWERRKAAVSELGEVRSELEVINLEKQRASQELAVMKEELDTLDSRRGEALVNLREVQLGAGELDSQIKNLRQETEKSRPVTGISGVEGANDEKLRSMNIRTIGELAEADPQKLQAGGIKPQTAKRMIRDAKVRVK